MNYLRWLKDGDQYRLEVREFNKWIPFNKSIYYEVDAQTTFNKCASLGYIQLNKLKEDYYGTNGNS